MVVLQVLNYRETSVPTALILALEGKKKQTKAKKPKQAFPLPYTRLLRFLQYCWQEMSKRLNQPPPCKLELTLFLIELSSLYFMNIISEVYFISIMGTDLLKEKDGI